MKQARDRAELTHRRWRLKIILKAFHNFHISMAKKRLGTDVERLCVDMQWEERDDMSC